MKKIALLHRHPVDRIKETNAAFPYLKSKGIDVLTFKEFDRTSKWGKFWKSVAWVIYAPMLVVGRGYDVIYCDDSYPFYHALVKIVSPKSKVVIRLGDLHLMYNYSGPAYRILHFFEKIGWLMADRIVAISDVMAQYIKAEIGRPVDVVFDPVEPEDFPPSIIQNYDVMFHGTLTKNKNVDVLLEAARRLPSIDFTIVGDGPDLNRLISIAPGNVHFTGWVPFRDIYRYVGACALGVALRSDNPGNEYVVTSPFLQYGVMGKPCLVTRRWVFGDYEWQFKGVDELVEKIKYFMETDFETQAHHGYKLRKYVLKHHSAKKIGEEIWSLLQ